MGLTEFLRTRGLEPLLRIIHVIAASSHVVARRACVTPSPAPPFQTRRGYSSSLEFAYAGVMDRVGGKLAGALRLLSVASDCRWTDRVQIAFITDRSFGSAPVTAYFPSW